MCSRHLPPSQPLSNVNEHSQSLISLNIRRFPRFSLKTCTLPILSISEFCLSATRSMFFAAVQRSLGSFQLHCARDFQAGMGAAAPVQILMWPTTLGGAAHRPRNPAPCVFATARLQGIGITHVLSSRNGGVTTPHPQGAPCAIHAWRFSFFVCDTLPLLFLFRLLRPRPAPPQRQTAHPRGSAPHHLIIWCPSDRHLAPRATTTLRHVTPHTSSRREHRFPTDTLPPPCP
ncbi:hypothetical protein EDB89DRAFT_113108 [Lactarius sanguifluus]|nr:hypothetical protein EDB89DRAFT_113108 [Lactarius sanguifluus]